MPKPFVVVIPSFNSGPWCERNLESVLTQAYESFRVIYVDDASTDDTPRLVAALLARSPEAHRVTFLRNEHRVGPLANIDRAVRSCEATDVIVLVDGDDFLAHRQVLSRLNTIYEDPDVWLTWGQFSRFPQDGGGFCAPIPSDIVSANAFRDYPFVSSHLRTFYAGLYHRIRLADLQDDEGRFFTIAGDVAQMFAMHEMAGFRGRFVPEVLYLYNRENPLSDDRVDRGGQVRTEHEIRDKPRYGRLPSLSSEGFPRDLHVASGRGRSLFDGRGPTPDADEERRPFRQLRAVLNTLGYTVRETRTPAEAESAQALVVFDVRPEEVDRLGRGPRDLLALVLWGDPISAPLNFDPRWHEAFQRIYTWCDDLVDNVRYFKFYYPSLRAMAPDVVPFAERKLCTLIASSRHSAHPDALCGEERRAVDFLARADGAAFDFYGEGCDPEAYPNCRGVPLSRVDRLRHYRFAFCYETVRGWSGYLTAKMFECFAAGCVPIYWGAPDVAKLVPRDCFIAREDFTSESAVHAFVKDMTADTHAAYLARIRAFLVSPQAVVHTPEYFTRTLVELIGGRAVPGARHRPAPGSAALDRAALRAGTSAE